jgi:hypothetical protein
MIDWGILDETRMHKHTYEAYKDQINIENIITTLFKDYKIRKQKVLQKTDKFAEAFHSMIKAIHLTLEMKTSFSNSMPVTGSSTESSSQRARVSADSHHQHCRREEKESMHTKSYKAKLGRLRSARLT